MRPRNVKTTAERIVGVAGYSALIKADLCIIEGKVIRAVMEAYGPPLNIADETEVKPRPGVAVLAPDADYQPA